MSEVSLESELEELADYLARSSKLTHREAKRVIDEVLSFCGELPDEFVRRRHLSLQTQGLSNREIFVQLSADIEQRRFRAPDYTMRQLRRMIYG